MSIAMNKGIKVLVSALLATFATALVASAIDISAGSPRGVRAGAGADTAALQAGQPATSYRPAV